MTMLTKWSCSQVQEAIIYRGDQTKWVASYDGFYLTRGHYSNNSSGTLHDFGLVELLGLHTVPREGLATIGKGRLGVLRVTCWMRSLVK